MTIEMARLLCLKPPTMDTQGVNAAAPLISQIKVIAPRVALEVIDRVPVHGGAGVSQDSPLRGCGRSAHPAPRRRPRRVLRRVISRPN